MHAFLPSLPSFVRSFLLHSFLPSMHSFPIHHFPPMLLPPRHCNPASKAPIEVKTSMLLCSPRMMLGKDWLTVKGGTAPLGENDGFKSFCFTQKLGRWTHFEDNIVQMGGSTTTIYTRPYGGDMGGVQYLVYWPQKPLFSLWHIACLLVYDLICH